MDPVYKGGPLGEPPAPSKSGAASRPPAAFEGELSFFSLPELIQLVCSGGHDSDIDILAEGTRAGNLLIRGGRVFRCTYGSMAGEAAFFQLARLRTGRFRVTPLPSEGSNDASLLNYSWQELLLETARREDEAKRIAASEPRDGKSPETKRSSRPSEGYIDLFNSAPPPAPPPPPLPRSDVYGRVEERGQLIPFPRKPVEDPIEDTVVSSSDLATEPISAPAPTPAPIASGRPNIVPTKPAPAFNDGGLSANLPHQAIPPPPPPSSPITSSKPGAPITAPSSPIALSKANAPLTSPSAPIPPSKPSSSGGGSPRSRPDPAFIPDPPRSRPGASIYEPAPESAPPLSLGPASLKNPAKAEGSRFAQLIQDATAAYLRRDYEMALKLFEECLTIDPSDRRVQHNIERIKNRRSRA